MGFHPATPAVEGITLCCYSRSRKAFLFRAVLKVTLNFNNTLTSHLNTWLSATLSLKLCEQTPWGLVIWSHCKVYFMTPSEKWNFKSLCKKVRWLANVSPVREGHSQRGIICLGIFRLMGVQWCHQLQHEIGAGKVSDIPFHFTY